MKSKLISAALLNAVVLSMLLGATSVHAQSPAPVGSPGAGAGAGAGAKPVTKNLLTQIIEGGWVMFPIAACSILTVYLVGEGVTRTNPKKLAPDEQGETVKNLFRAGDYVGAYNFCKANPSPMTNVVRVGVSYLGDGQNMTENAMSEELAKENASLQTRLSYLSVIGVCTPMIGLLGTVTGMMSAFSTLGTSGIGDPSRLAGAIGEVLIATASGLFIAIPAFGFFYYLRNRAASGLHVIEDTVNSLFRKMPYEMLHNVHIGDEEIYAAAPNWIEAQPGTGMNTGLTGRLTASLPAPAPGSATGSATGSLEGQTVTAQAPL